MVDNIEKELEILWEFMPEKYFNEIGKRLLSHGIKQTQSKYWVKDLINKGDKKDIDWNYLKFINSKKLNEVKK